MEKTNYDVFISYSRKDYVDDQKNVIPGNEVSKIKEALTNAGITYWIDEKGIVPGEDYGAKITKHIKACKIFVYISSEAANQAYWTRNEIACALLYKKHIIPLLLDDSPFHDSVIIRIAVLDRIDYYLNPKLGLDKLIRSIKTCLEEFAKEEQRRKDEEEKRKQIELKKKEELRLQKEQEEKRRQEEQERLITEIKRSCTTLNNEEAKLELDRNNLLLKAESVTDNDKRENIKSLIKTGGIIREKYCSELITEVNHLKEDNLELELAISSLQSVVGEKEAQIVELKAQLDCANTKIVELETNKGNNNLGDVNQNDSIAANANEGTAVSNPTRKSSLMVHGGYSVVIAIILIILLYYFSWDNSLSKEKSDDIISAMSIAQSEQNKNVGGSEPSTFFIKGNELYNKYYSEKAGKRDGRYLQDAFQSWRKAADQGLAEAQDSVGMCYYRGRGVTKDYGKAVEYFEKASKQGLIDATYRLGLCYYYGNTSGSSQSKKNINKALHYFKRAADKGHSGGLCYTGICYYDKRDYEKSYDWLEKAEKAGSIKALYWLGLHYHVGHYKKQDREKAFIYFKKAAEKGETDAQYYTGIYYEKGYGGVLKDLSTAKEWYKKAADRGSGAAKDELLPK